MSVHTALVPTYAEILARNIRAARARADLGQDAVAARMRALGYEAWVRQTVSSTERGRRRPTAEEVLALSFVLTTTVQALMRTEFNDEDVTFPSGNKMPVGYVRTAVTTPNGWGIKWEGDQPVWPVYPQKTDEGE